MGTHPIFESDFDCLTEFENDMIIDSDNLLLKIGLEVSAKFKGAYCEARIHSVDSEFRVKLRFPDGRTFQTSDKNCHGHIKIGATVTYQGLQATVVKMKDVSTYTVVFDDLDERKIKRGSLCIKGQRHFDDSVTLDSLPLNDPEHFGDKVNKGDLLNQSASTSFDGIFTTDDTSEIAEELTNEKNEECSEHSAEEHSEKNELPPQQNQHQKGGESSLLQLKRSYAEMNEDQDFDSQYRINQNELDQADGPDERINVLEIHLFYLSNQYQTLKSELNDIDKILQGEKEKKDGRRKRHRLHSKTASSSTEERTVRTDDAS